MVIKIVIMTVYLLICLAGIFYEMMRFKADVPAIFRYIKLLKLISGIIGVVFFIVKQINMLKIFGITGFIISLIMVCIILSNVSNGELGENEIPPEVISQILMISLAVI